MRTLGRYCLLIIYVLVSFAVLIQALSINVDDEPITHFIWLKINSLCYAYILYLTGKNMYCKRLFPDVVYKLLKK